MFNKLTFVLAVIVLVLFVCRNVFPGIFIAPPGIREDNSLHQKASRSMYVFSDIIDNMPAQLVFVNGKKIDSLMMKTDFLDRLDSEDLHIRQHAENTVFIMSEYLGYPEEIKKRCLLNDEQRFLLINMDVLTDLFIRILKRNDALLRLAGIEGLSRIDMETAEDKEKIIRGFIVAAGSEDDEVKAKAHEALSKAVKSCICGIIGYEVILNVLKDYDHRVIQPIVDENPQLFTDLFLHSYFHGRGDIPEIAKGFFVTIDMEKINRFASYIFSYKRCLNHSN